MSHEANSLELRKKILALRRGQSLGERNRRSEMIFERWRQAFPAQASVSSKAVALYRAMAEEVDITPVQKFLSSLGARLYFPRLASTDALEFDLVRVDASTQWKKGTFGIEEPVSGEVLASPGDLMMVFVPGVVFGPEGERVGMGKGHYDRFLAKNDHALRVSLAFDFQCGENIHQNSWDQPVDWIFTEVREFRGKNWSRRMGSLTSQLRK